MFRHILLAAPGALALAACGGSPPTTDSPQDTATPASQETAAEPSVAAPSVPSVPPISATEAPSVPRSSPVASASLSPQAQKGSAGAEAVLQTWARALETRQSDLAWQQFRDPPASRTDFRKWWERYRSIEVTLGEGQGDAAMGSLYFTAPVTLTGTTIQGKPFRLQGDVVLRRVNDVDGATPAQLRWHIGTADLKDAPTP